MPKFSNTSLKRIQECHPDLQTLFYSVVKDVDCSVLCGYRGRDEQEAAFAAKTSKARFGESPHNEVPSMAADVVPYPVDWNNLQRFEEFANIVKKRAGELGIQIVWGGDFKDFPDRPHFQLASWRKKV